MSNNLQIVLLLAAVWGVFVFAALLEDLPPVRRWLDEQDRRDRERGWQ